MKAGFTMAEPFGELKAYEPSWRDQLTGLIARALGDDRTGFQRAQKITGIADFLPGVGTGLAIDDTARDLDAGDWLGAGFSAMGLIPGAGKAAGKAGKAGTKALKEALGGGEDAVRKEVDTLFETGVRPQVPQYDIKRYEPPRGVPERVTAATSNPDVRTGMLKAIERGKSMGAQDWYNMEPLRLKFAEQYGPEEGTQRFNRYLDYVAGSSPRSSVPENLRNASYYYSLDVNDLPLEEPRVIPGAGRGGADKKVKNPEPYGHIAQDLHRMNFEKIRSGQGLDFKANPKPLGFAEGLKGNMRPVAVDTHAFRLPSILSEDPRFLERRYQSVPGAPIRNIQDEVASGQTSMQTALGEPAFWSSKPEENEYLAMERFYQSLADEVGMAPGETQAAAWVGGGPMTGLRSSDTKSAMDLFKDVVTRTAVKKGMDPRDVLAQFMSGRGPLLSLGGGAALGGLALDDGDQP
jgi:hypothetical protein